MALIQRNNSELSNDLDGFKRSYDKTYEEFIDYHGDDNIIIDLSDKIVVALESHCLDNIKTPCNILSVFIPEIGKFKYKPTLIYSGHIAFIKCEFDSGNVIYRYKDDECYPQTLKEVLEIDNYGSDSPLVYSAKDNGFDREDIITHIERYIQVSHDFNYKICDLDNIIVLEGL